MTIRMELDPAFRQKGHWWNINYYHFFTQKLTQLWKLVSANGGHYAGKVTVVYDGKFPYLIEGLGFEVIKELAPGENEVVIKPMDIEPLDSQFIPVVARRIVSRSVSENSAPHWITIFNRRGCRKTGDIPKLVEDLEQLAPVRVVDFWGWSLAKQIETVRTSRLLVGVHGAEFTNMAFMHPGAAIIEMMPYGFDHNGFQKIGALVGVRRFKITSPYPPPGIDEPSDELAKRCLRHDPIRFKVRDVPVVSVDRYKLLTYAAYALATEHFD